MDPRYYDPIPVDESEAAARRAARAAARAIVKRDDSIARLRAEGKSIRRIAEIVELPHTTVADILRRLPKS
jgi:DNA-binding NarL/FixJ family response regulator